MLEFDSFNCLSSRQLNLNLDIKQFQEMPKTLISTSNIEYLSHINLSNQRIKKRKGQIT